MGSIWPRKTTMTIIFIALVVMSLFGFRLYEKLELWWYVRKNYPEHIRDRNKKLEVGQIWEDEGWMTKITAISADRIDYLYAVPKLKTSNGAYSSSSTPEEFRERINTHKLHLQEP
jgi:hypothetical protein